MNLTFYALLFLSIIVMNVCSFISGYLITSDMRLYLLAFCPSMVLSAVLFLALEDSK